MQLRWLWKRSCGLTRLSAHGRTMPIVCPGLRDPRIPPFSECLSGEAVWDGHRQLDGVDGALLVWQMEERWWKMVGAGVTARPMCPWLLGQKRPVRVRRCVSSCLRLHLEGWELSFECL